MRNNFFTQKFAPPILLLIALGWCTHINAQNGEEGWTKLASMSTDRALFAASYLEGKIYAIGGVDAINFLGNAEVYDISLNEWTPVANLHKSRVGLIAVTWNNKIYAIGGLENEFATSTNVEIYDPVSDEWTIMGDSPIKRIGCTSCLYNNLVYAFGGYDDSLYSSTKMSYTYNPETDAWDSIAPMISLRSYSGCCVFDNKIYIFGGIHGFDPNDKFNKAEVYDPETDTYTEIANLPEATSSPVVYLDENTNKIVIFDDSWHVFTYDPLTDSYTRMRDMQYLMGGPASVKINRDIYMIGGLNYSDYTFSKALWKFNLDSLKEWTEPVSVGSGRAGNTAFNLLGIFPNPSVEFARIQYELAVPGEVKLEIFNCLGERLAVLADQQQAAGAHFITWQTDEVPSGVYFCNLKVNGMVQTQKFIISH